MGGMRGTGRVLLSFSGTIFAASCGAGTAGIIAGADDGGGGSNSAAALQELSLPQRKVSPARIAFDLSDREGETVSIRLFGRAPQPGGGLGNRFELHRVEINGQPFPETISVPANVVKPIEVDWFFDEDPELQGTAFVEGIQLITVLNTGEEDSIGPSDPDLPEESLGVGNDKPVVMDPPRAIIDPGEDEVAGLVRFPIRLKDSSDDVVSVAVTFDVLDDSIGPQPATGFGLSGVQVSRDGTTLDYFWDSETDLNDREGMVVLTFVPNDGALNGVGDPVEADPVHVDNNEEPIIQLDSGSIIANTDERRGIPIPFNVIDEETDSAEVILQWRLQDEPFPSLGENGNLTNDELDRILSDPAKRAEKHICTPHPYFAHGVVDPVTADLPDKSVRLPELARSMSWITVHGLTDRTLEILRPSSIPESITSTWAKNPFASPVAALPFGDGLNTLVLDRTGSTWRLRAFELATGRPLPDEPGTVPLVVNGSSLPTAMCFERGERAVLVASEHMGGWLIERVPIDLATLRVEPTQEVVFENGEPGPVHGIASLGEGAAVITLASSLFHLDYRDLSAPELGSLLEDLQSPRGVVVDLLDPMRVYVSEHDANRVLSVELDAHAKLPVVVKTEDALPTEIDHPGALALESEASRLLVVTDTLGSGWQLTGVDLGTRGANTAFAIGPPSQKEITSVACGPAGLRLLAVRDRDELFVAAGIEQRRTIENYDESRHQVTVDLPFDPKVADITFDPRIARKLWRIPDERSAGQRQLRSSPSGERHVFLWSSDTDLPGGGAVFVRGLARDEEIGVVATGFAPKTVRSGLDVAPIRLGRSEEEQEGGEVFTQSPRMTAIGDLNGDGRLDLVSANQGTAVGADDNVTVFIQTPDGKFPIEPTQTLGGPTTPRVQYVALGDINGDGRLDIVSANRNRIRNAAGEELGGGDLTVFLQRQDGTFPVEPSLYMGGLGAPRRLRQRSVSDGGDEGRDPRLPPITQGPCSVAVGDLNGDGRLDIVSANEGEQPTGNPRRYDDLTIFLQDSSGGFSSEPSIRLGNSSTTRRPQSVAIGDLDSDGDLDLVSANEDGDDLTIFLQVSQGSFQLSVPALGGPGVTDGPEFVAIADLDADGAQDIVSVNEDSDSFTVFFQESTGSFTPLLPPLGGSPETVGPESVAVGDLDGDGDLDLVSTNEDGTNLALFYQVAPRRGTPDDSSDRVFAKAARVGGPGMTNDPHGVSVGDLDGDGDLDLVSANDEGDDLTLFYQKTTGGFAFPVPVGGFPTTNQPVCIALGDLDADGDQDLVSGNRDGDNLTIFGQDPPGNLFLGQTLGNELTTNFPHGVAIGDLDSDGLLDVVSANKDVTTDDLGNVIGGSNLAIFLQDDGALGLFFGVSFHLGGSEITLNPRSVAVADLDGNGSQDLVSANEGNDSLTVFLRTFAGEFSLDDSLATGDAPFSVAVGDLDRNGQLDLVSANRTGNSLSVYLQETSGTFTLSTPLGDVTTTSLARSVAIGDLDGDGDSDIVSANEGGDCLTVFFQANGNLGSRISLLGSSLDTDAPFSVAIDDLDGDGDQDVVSANERGNSLAVFFQSRLGIFTRSQRLGGAGATPGPQSVAIGDLDGDGDGDIVSANRGTFPGDARDGKLTVFFGGR